MNENRDRRSTATWLVAAVCLIAPAVSRAEVDVVPTLSFQASRAAHILGVIDEGPTPITQIASRVAYYFGVIDEGPDPITRYRLGVIDESPDPITQRRPRSVVTRSGTTSR